MATNYPVGKGMYIWKLASLFRGDLAAMVAEARRLSLQWVSIKVAESATAYQTNAVGAAVAAFRDAGLEVWGWQFVYGHNQGGADVSQLEGQAGASIARSLGLAGLMIDGEGHYEALPWLDAKACALRYVMALRSGGVNAIGLNSYRFPSLHRRFPFAEMLTACTFHIPQVYWEMDNRMNGPELQLAQSVRELKAIRNLPVVPLGIACQDNLWKPTPQQIDNFNHAALAMLLPGVGWYEWAAMNTQPELAEAVRGANGWEGEAPEPAPVPEPAPAPQPQPAQGKRVELLGNLILRAGAAVTAGRLTAVYKGSVFEIQEEKAGWYRVTDTGWIMGGQYTKVL